MSTYQQEVCFCVFRCEELWLGLGMFGLGVNFFFVRVGTDKEAVKFSSGPNFASSYIY